MTERPEQGQPPAAEAAHALIERSRQLYLAPGWALRAAPGSTEPQAPSRFVPMHWSYAACRDLLQTAGASIDVALAERRNLLLRNPVEGNSFWTSNTLLAAYQMILPGEFARPHRHAPHALRVIIEGEGAYSIVDGEKMPMQPGDVVLTPGGSWHSHGHAGESPAFWLDGLDSPLVRQLEVMSYEEPAERAEAALRVVADSPWRFSAAQIAQRLDEARPDPEGFHGVRVVLEAPAMPSLGLSVERLAAGARTRPHRSNANRLFSVMSGRGRTWLAGECFEWAPGDTLVAPSWVRIAHEVFSDAVLSDLSDEPLKRFARYYRFQDDS